MIYDCIIIGGGASGLFAASLLKVNNGLILEGSKAIGTKLLMSGSGQCNITHGGSIKNYVEKYGDNGKKIRSCLYKHSNQSLINHIESLGVPLFERDDGKVFPVSLSAKDVKDALMAKAKSNGFEVKTMAAVTSLCYAQSNNASAHALKDDISCNNFSGSLIQVSTEKKGDTSTKQDTYLAKAVIIATGGASYSSTGSDGSFFKVMSAFKENVEILKPRPSLVPVYVENYLFGELSGMSFKDVKLTIYKSKGEGDTAGSFDALRKPIVREGSLLLTHKNLSGPLILDASRYIVAGDKLTFNFCPGLSFERLFEVLKQHSAGSQKGTAAFITEVFGNLGIAMPQRFISAVISNLFANSCDYSNSSKCTGAKSRSLNTSVMAADTDNILPIEKKAADLSKKDLQALARAFTEMTFTASGTGSFREAMCTAGGLSLSEIDVKTMEWMPGIFVIGEALDVDGDTGGYNLQFAYSSAATATEQIKSLLLFPQHILA